MRYLLVPLLLTLATCGPTSGTSDGGVSPEADASVTVDAPTTIFYDATKLPDASSAYADAAVYPDGGCGDDWVCTDPVDDGCDLGGADVCGDGADNNCNGEVDEGCACTPGNVQPCFLGPPGNRGVGACTDGAQTCHGSGEFTYWGDCSGGIWPGTEVCDSLDNSCDGCVDDHPDCCDAELACPNSADLPEGAPFNDYIIDGTAYWSGSYDTWTWTVVGGPCDQLLDATSSSVSYTLTGANTPTLTFHPTLSGDYTVTMTVVVGGVVYTCTFIVHIAGPGLRVELCWDTTGDADIDLHLHKPDSTTPWFFTTIGGDTINDDDCFYMNCTASDYCSLYPILCTLGDPADWGYADSAVTECSGGPEGDIWTMYGACANPRLDMDNIWDVGRAENINVDVPANGKAYRVMVHYYQGSAYTHPMVNIYCGGRLETTYGAAPDFAEGFDSGGADGAGPMWRVADITPTVAGGVTTGCSINALGLVVTDDDSTF